MSAAIDITGQTFGRLTAVQRVGTTQHKKALWLFTCECGNTTRTTAVDVRSGHTKSCGCLDLERKTDHGMATSPEYRTWWNMIQRCTNPKAPNYQNYGGRGIKVCEEWRNFENFIADMGMRPTNKHSIERKDVNGHYGADNCIWADASTQIANKRIKPTNTSGFIGVTAKFGKWESLVTWKGVRHYLGLFSDPELAALVRDEFICKHNLPHKLNN